MVIDKKTIIIIIIACVVAYIIWKKSKQVKDDVDTSPDSDSVDTSSEISLDYIFTHIPFTKAERTAIETSARNAENSLIKKQSIQAKAYNNNLSYAQQLVLDTIWNLYTKNGEWQAVNGSTSYGWELSKKVKNL